MTNRPFFNTLINHDRLWARHEEMAKLGATANGGVNRAALTQADIEVHLKLAERARDRGFFVEIDEYGNQFMRRPGTQPGLAALASGSHSDTQPTGGRFDGIFGVLAAFEVLETIDDAGVQTRHAMEAIIWNNEEGVRFFPTAFGSAVYVGDVAICDLLESKDREGITVAAAVEGLRSAIPWAATRELKTPLAGFVEAHIEQGPELENEALTIGVVTGIQGTRKFLVEVTGEEAHAGTTPRRARRDAFVDAINVVNALHAVFHDPDDIVRFTIGCFQVEPGVLAVVPSKVVIQIDFRHPNIEALQRLGDQVEQLCRDAAQKCDIYVRETGRASPIRFEGPVPEAVRRAAGERGYRWKNMPSGAGHDARHLAGFCPTGMIFVPCEKGISHNERENAKSSDLAAGAQVLADTLLALDSSETQCHEL